MTIDPMEEFWSPYLAMGNDPVSLADPTGGITSPPDWYLNNSTQKIEWIPGSKHIDGFTHLGKDLAFVFNSFIDGDLFDGPNPPWGVDGDKLTSYLFLDAIQDNNGNLLSVNLTSDYNIHSTGGLAVFKGRDYFPGQQNKAVSVSGLSFNTSFEQHASVPRTEEIGLSILGYDMVNIAQKIDISLSNGKLSVQAYTDIFPSATFSVNGMQLFKYTQPSFVRTHGRTPIGINPLINSHSGQYKSNRPHPNFYLRFPQK